MQVLSSSLLIVIGLLLLPASAAATGAVYGQVPLEFLIGKAHLRLYELDGSCVIDIAPMSAKAPRQQLKLPLMGHCDVMTMGASQNFAVDARGDARSGKYMVRVVGGLQWQSAVRAECGSAVSDVLVDARARTVSLAPQAAGIAGGYCPRLYNQDRKWP